MSKIDEIADKVQRAHEMVSKLCQGDARWVMSIPAQPDSDPDLVISAGLRAAGDAVAELAACRETIERQAALIAYLTRALETIADTSADDEKGWVRMTAVADVALVSAREGRTP